VLGLSFGDFVHIFMCRRFVCWTRPLFATNKRVVYRIKIFASLTTRSIYATFVYLFAFTAKVHPLDRYRKDEFQTVGVFINFDAASNALIRA
jgi:hypothetical protein